MGGGGLDWDQHEWDSGCSRDSTDGHLSGGAEALAIACFIEGIDDGGEVDDRRWDGRIHAHLPCTYIHEEPASILKAYKRLTRSSSLSVAVAAVVVFFCRWFAGLTPRAAMGQERQGQESAAALNSQHFSLGQGWLGRRDVSQLRRRDGEPGAWEQTQRVCAVGVYLTDYS